MIDLFNYISDDKPVGGLTFEITYEEDTAHVDATLDADGHTLDITVAPDWWGTADLKITATDIDTLEAETDAFTITVTSVNDPPILEDPGPQTAISGIPFELTLNATDPDLELDTSEKLTFKDNSPLFVVDPFTGVVNFVPTTNDVRSYTIRFTVTDEDQVPSYVEVAFDVLPNVPSAPIDLVADVKHEVIKLAWDPPMDDGGSVLMHYIVFRGGSADELEEIGTTKDAFLNDTDLRYGVSFHYGVVAVNSVGEGPLSDLVEATPIKNKVPSIISEPPLTVYVGHEYTYEVIVVDEDSTKFDYEFTQAPDYMLLHQDGSISWVPKQGGDFKVELKVSDDLDAWTTQMWIITVWDMQPVIKVTIDSPADLATVKGTVTIGGTATINQGFLMGVEVKIGDNDWVTANGTKAWFLDLNTTELEDGDYEIKARATDGIHRSDVTLITITVKNKAKRPVDDVGLGSIFNMYLLISIILIVVAMVIGAWYLKTRRPAEAPRIPEDDNEYNGRY